MASLEHSEGSSAGPPEVPVALLRALVDHLTDGLLVRDPAGRLIYANEAAARSIGYPSVAALLEASDTERAAPWQIWNELGAPVAVSDLHSARVFATGEGGEELVRYRPRGGTSDDDRWALLRTLIVPDGQGHLGLVVIVMHDQTERKRREEDAAFRAEASARLASALVLEDALRALAELAVERLASGAFVYLVAPGGALTLAARAADRPDVLPPDPAALGSAAHEAETRAHGGGTLIEAPLRARDRHLGVLALVRVAGRRPFGPPELALARSVAVRAALAVDNARLADEAQRAVQAREDFLAVASHDLKSPLAAILFSASAILRDAPEGRVRRGAETVLQAAESMERLVHDLVDLGAIESGRLALTLRPHDALELVRSAAALLEPLASRRSVSLRVEGETLVLARCDRERVLQVLINLITNAVEFSPAGSEVRLRVARDHGRALVAVLDQGPGIAPAALPHVFDRYWQAEGRGPGAVGLGLSIAKALVTAHGGEIWVTSEPARGSSFFFSLALA